MWVNNSDFKQKIINFAKLKGDEKILDVGIGAGDLSGLFNSKEVTGIDFSKTMLSECKKLHPEFKLVLADAEKLPFSDEKFDVVCCRNFLQNFNDPSMAFGEMVRVTKTGGKIIVIESAVYENERAFPTDFCRIAEPFHPLFPSHESLFFLFTKNNIKKIKQMVVGVHKKWLTKWQLSKKTSEEEKIKGYRICENYPAWYKKSYKMKFFPEETEIESTLTFSFIKGEK